MLNNLISHLLQGIYGYKLIKIKAARITNIENSYNTFKIVLEL